MDRCAYTYIDRETIFRETLDRLRSREEGPPWNDNRAVWCSRWTFQRGFDIILRKDTGLVVGIIPDKKRTSEYVGRYTNSFRQAKKISARIQKLQESTNNLEPSEEEELLKLKALSQPYVRYIPWNVLEHLFPDMFERLEKEMIDLKLIFAEPRVTQYRYDLDLLAKANEDQTWHTIWIQLKPRPKAQVRQKPTFNRVQIAGLEPR